MSLVQEHAQKREKQKAALVKRDKELRNIFNELCTKAEGILAMRHLMQICGYDQSSVVANTQTGEIQSLGTLYNEGRRNVYREIRHYINPKFLKRIEFKTQS